MTYFIELASVVISIVNTNLAAEDACVAAN